MRLIVPMYHRARAGRFGNSEAMLDAHFAYVARSCHAVLPGDALASDRLNVCLTFDDGTLDFHRVVFPLLRKHRLRALLAVPLAFVQEGHPAEGPDAHCGWNELAEMHADGAVAIAAHGFTHRRLDRSDADLHAEIVVPQTVLAARIGCAVDSFVLPYGRFTKAVIDEARRRYRYVFRIGGADNRDWQGRLLYRVDADAMTAPDALFSQRNLMTYRVRRRWNLLRGR
jgi:peptidoglycan/xylan/chitin deacetylase (PgdA/CDA1 family)